MRLLCHIGTGTGATCAFSMRRLLLEKDSKIKGALRAPDAQNPYRRSYGWTQRGWEGEDHSKAISLATAMMNGKAVIAQKQTQREADVLVRRLQSEGLGAAAYRHEQLPEQIAQGMRAGEATFRQITGRQPASPVTFTVGELVEVTASAEELPILSFGHGGYSRRMARTCGKVGRVVCVDAVGDVQVEFGGGTQFYFNPSALASKARASASASTSSQAREDAGIDFLEDEAKAEAR